MSRERFRKEVCEDVKGARVIRLDLGGSSPELLRLKNDSERLGDGQGEGFGRGVKWWSAVLLLEKNVG
jgi:hypothetical protein